MRLAEIEPKDMAPVGEALDDLDRRLDLVDRPACGRPSSA
jgi:hypothetical protein